MEILDKNKIAFIENYYSDLMESFIKIFRRRPTESVGIYVSDNYVYMASIFYDSGNWHILSADKNELPLYNYEEVAAKWSRDKIDVNDLNNAVVTLGTPDKILLKREIELEKVPKENVKEALYWDFCTNFFENDQEFNIAYYPLDGDLYFAAALEIRNQKYVDDFFRKKEITISNWVTFPENFQLELNGQNISIFDVNINVPADMDMRKLKEYTPAVYAAMVGANLFDKEKNIIFPPLYNTELLNWKLVALNTFIVGLCLMGSVFAYDIYKISSLQEELNNANNELKNLSVDKTRMQIYNDIIKDTKMREETIADKTKKRIPFQALLLHLGTITQEGVVLTAVKSDKSNIVIEGKANTQEDLENFLNEINERKDIFIKSPKSLKIDKKDVINFSFTMDLQVGK